MTFSIAIQFDAESDADLTAQLQNAAATVLVQHAAPANAALTVLLTDDDTLQQLNQQFRNIDAVTDVLSFSDGTNSYLGDIAISVAQAQRQANSGGHRLSDELMLLTIHGVLHLLGYDHANSAEKEKMWAAQSAALAACHAAITEPASDE